MSGEGRAPGRDAVAGGPRAGSGGPLAGAGASPAEPDGAAASPERIQRYYADRLADGGGCCGGAVTWTGAGELESAVPSFGCGEPTLFADLAPGERVLDLGSGAGLDALRAAEAVGASGSVVGVDMTPAMLERARSGAARLGLGNVMFVKGFIEALPLPDASVDAVLSNCVVNLSADKAAVFREAYRVLRPGGRLAISDVLRRGPPPGAASEEGWCACVDGAEGADAYLGHLGAAGFVDVRIEPPASGDAAPGTYSASVRAVRPALRPATSDDQAAIAALLESSGLPTDGLAAAVARAFVLEGGGALRGVVAFERYGEAALLRSLAVRADDRGRGYGLALVRHVEREARAAGATEAYALTTTVERWLPRLGYREVARVDLPAALRASPELRGACPASARAFAKALVGDG